MSDWGLYDGARWEGAGAVTASTRGTTLTADASVAGTKGAWVELVASLAVHGDGILISVVAPDQPSKYSVDIAIGGLGSEVVVIPDIIVATPRTSQGSLTLFLPLALAKGSRIAARTSATELSAGIDILIAVLQTGFATMPPFGVITQAGAGGNTAGGTTVDPGGTANTRVITELTTGISHRTRAIMLVITARGNTAHATARWLLDLCIGAGGSEVVIVPEFLAETAAIPDDFAHRVFGPFLVNIPASTRIALGARCSINDATDRLLEAVVYCLD